jgi:hypothetical protein
MVISSPFQCADHLQAEASLGRATLNRWIEPGWNDLPHRSTGFLRRKT